jgi:hypothetical protein
VAERSPLAAPGLLEFISVLRLRNVPLGDDTLQPFWASSDKNFTSKGSFPGALLRLGDWEDRHISTCGHFLLDLFLSFSSWFPYNKEHIAWKWRRLRNSLLKEEKKGQTSKVTNQCFNKWFESPRLQMQLRCTAAKLFKQRPPSSKPD